MNLLAAIEAETSIVCVPSDELSHQFVQLLTSPALTPPAVSTATVSQPRLAEHGPVRVVAISPATGAVHLPEVMNKRPNQKNSGSARTFHAFLSHDGLFLFAETAGSGPLAITAVVNLSKAVLAIHPVVHSTWIDWQWEIVHAGGSLMLASAAELPKSIAWLSSLRAVVLRCATTAAPATTSLSDLSELIPLHHRVIRGTLHWAAATSNVTLLRELLQLQGVLDDVPGFTCSSKDDIGRTPLHYAALSGNVRAL